MTFLITGAGRGLGLEFTRQLLAKKNSVVAWVRDATKAPELKTLESDYPGQLVIQTVDISNPTSIQAAAAQNKHIDVLINNAGVLVDSAKNFFSLTKEDLEKTFAVNVIAPIQVAQAIVPLMKNSASALVINISSKMGSIADNSSGGHYAYRSSKTALNMITKNFSIDNPKIKTLCMHPGWVKTDMGGANATTTITDSVTGLLKVILKHDSYKSGEFVDFTGERLPW